MLRGPVACQGERKGCAGADCIADVSVCLREALKLTIKIRLKLFSFGSGTESPLDCFQSHYQSALVQKWSSDHKIAGNKKPQGHIVPWGFSVFWCPETESNRRHGDFQSPALPTELSGQRGALNWFFRGSSSKFSKNI